jgi:DnaJ-domain-containing protein 1
VGAVFKRLLWVALVATGFSRTAAAEELIMPFSCAVQDGAVQLAPSAETTYKIAGARQEQIFSACRGSTTGTCEIMMVHRFAIQCVGAKASWAQVVQAASRLGIEVPQGLPQGFAPAGTLKARFVFPALARFNSFRSEVETEQLSADGVAAHDDGEAAARVAAWHTEVRADMAPQGSVGAFGVGAIVSFLMLLLIGASLMAAGRWRMLQFSGAMLRERVPRYVQQLASWSSESFGRAWHWMRGEGENSGDAELANAAAVAMARLIEAELHVAALPSGLLLREVLLSELDRVRERLNSVTRDLDRRPKDKSAGMIRSVLRDLERIGRIAHGAGKDQRHEPGSSAGQTAGTPQSVTEAYRVLGINVDAEPAVTKKLVDALRMSWHPDYARDEADRLKREDRIKQINAAWDLIKDQRRAA